MGKDSSVLEIVQNGQSAEYIREQEQILLKSSTGDLSISSAGEDEEATAAKDDIKQLHLVSVRSTGTLSSTNDSEGSVGVHGSSTEEVGKIRGREATLAVLRPAADIPNTRLARENGTSCQVPGAYAEAPLGELLRPAARPEPDQENGDRSDTSIGPEEEARIGENTGLAIAVQVLEEGRQMAEPVRLVGQAADDKRESKRSLKNCLFCVLAIANVVGLVLLVVLMTTARDSTPSDGEALTPEELTSTWLPEHTKNAIQDPTSAQAQAHRWLLEDPNFVDYSNTRKLQRFALATFHYSTGGEDWYANGDWLSYDLHECLWELPDLVARTEIMGPQDHLLVGFFNNMNSTNAPCELDQSTGELIYSHLALPAAGLSGSIPLELYQLTNLKTLMLTQASSLASTISSQIAQLTSLEVLFISNTGIGGTVPSEIGSLDRLKALSLANNQLTSTLPSQLGLLSNSLSIALDLSENTFSGTIPHQLGSLTELKIMLLYLNRLTGGVPSQLGRATGLEALHLCYNLLSGEVPTQLGLIKSLDYLAMAGNVLTSNIPSQLGELTLVKEFLLQFNQLEGTIPSELGRLSSLVLLGLDHNGLSGSLPSQFGLLDTTAYFSLRKNKLGGKIPSEIGLASSLIIVGLEDNQFTGQLPSELALLTGLEGLYAERNQITGAVPAELATLEKLVALNLAENAFSGVVAEKLCDIGPAAASSCHLRDCGFYFDCSAELCGCDCPCCSECG